ncbi:hypothetical protein BGZ76_010575 [Entomortierella beljakovae]|nr:hypothetical protein BGZ76_010575 [Entomortierella beljakovae]
MNLSLFILTLSIITASATATSSAATISISATTSSPTTLAVDITTTTATADTATIPTTTTSITATYKNDKKPLVDLVESKNDGSNIWNMNDIHSTEDQDNFGMHIVSLHSREDPQDSSRVPIMVEIPDSTGKSGSNIPRALHSTTPTKLGSKNKKNDGDNNKAKTRHGRTDDNPKKDFPNISTPNHLKKSSRISNSNTQSSINHINNNITDHANINATTNHNLTNDTQDWKEPPTAPRTIVITLCIVIASLIGCFLCIIGMFKLVNVYCLGRFDHRKPTFVRLVSLKRQQQQQQQQQQHDHYPYKKHPHSISGKMISLPKPLLEPLNDSDIPSRNSDTSKTSKQLKPILVQPLYTLLRH